MDNEEILSETNNNKKGNKNKSFKLKYYVSDDLSEIQIFGETFVKNNKDKCHLIIENNDCELRAFYKFKTKGEKPIILVIDEEDINFIGMFKPKLDYEDFYIYDIHLQNEYDDSRHYNNKSLIDISSLESLDTSEVTDLEGMFCGCWNIKNFKFLKDWDVSKCKNFSYLFEDCSFSEIDFLSNWNVSNSTHLNSMFYGCSNLVNIKGIKNWYVENVTNFECMFENCRQLEDVNDLQNWNMNKAKNIREMFANCNKLINMNSLYKWKLNEGVDKTDIIYNCNNLLNIPSIFEKTNSSSCEIL